MRFERLRSFWQRHRVTVLFLYLPVYLIWFFALEHRGPVDYTYVHCIVDDWIPFCEYFIVPYYLWFAYIAVAVIALMLHAKEHPDDFYHCAEALIIGMTAFLLLNTFWPTAQTMRPSSFARDNIFTRLVAMIYAADTSTNVFPSIHVYNSLVIHAALCKSHMMKGHKALRMASLVLCILICISTVTLKQHSFVDVVGGSVLFVFVYQLVYHGSLVHGRFFRRHRADSLE